MCVHLRVNIGESKFICNNNSINAHYILEQRHSSKASQLHYLQNKDDMVRYDKKLPRHKEYEG